MAFTFKPNKRSRNADADSDSEDDDVDIWTAAGAWPRFLVVEAEDSANPLSRISPFLMQKWFEGVSSSIKDIKKLGSGAFLVNCPTEKVSRLLSGRNGGVCVDRKIRVSPHKTLNTCKGVLRCRELENVSDAEILLNLKSQGVMEVHRVLRKKGDTRVPTNTFFLTFALAKLPGSVKIGYLHEKICPFIPSPLRCFNCQKFGHSRGRCRREPICERCGQEAHDGACTENPSCTNCKGNHSPNSRDCPTYKMEQQIQKVRTEKKVSFAAAKQEVMNQNQFQGASFASVVSKKSKSVGKSVEAQVGDGIPPGMLDQLRKDFPNVNRPSLATGQVSTSTQVHPGSSALAPAPQAAKARQAPKPAGQASKACWAGLQTCPIL